MANITGNPFCIWYGELHNESKNFIYENHVLFNKDKTTLITYRNKETSYIIPNNVTNIEDCAFCGCEYLTNINIPNSVTNIGSYAFGDCNSLISIDIPNSVTSIGEGAFSGCKSLTSINIPNSVTNIEKGAFGRCYNISSKIEFDLIQRFGEKVFK